MFDKREIEEAYKTLKIESDWIRLIRSDWIWLDQIGLDQIGSDWGNPMTYSILDWKIHNASRELK